MLDNQTRRELLSKARESGFPGSILDVFAAYEQGRDLVAEFQQYQQQQQTQQMSDAAAQEAGMQMPEQMQMQQPQQQGPPQPQGPPPGLPQGSRIPQPQSPNTGLVNSNESQGTGIASNSGGARGSQEILAMGGFREDEYNKFSTHFPFSKEQRGSIAHNATVERPDLTMVQGKKYVFGGLKYETGGPVAKAVEKTLTIDPDADPETMFYGKYNTPLNEREQRRFDNWAIKQSERQGRNIMMDKGAYDIQGFWKSGDWKRMDADNHGTDTWKKPNHPTFSNHSRYHGADGWYGGNWTEEAGYQPSKKTANTYSQEYYAHLFGNEPNRLEHIDMSRYDGKNLGTPVVYKKGGFKYENGGPGDPIKPKPAPVQPFPDFYNENKKEFDAADAAGRQRLTTWFDERAAAPNVYPEHTKSANTMSEYLKNSGQSIYVPEPKIGKGEDAGQAFKKMFTGIEMADSQAFANEADYTQRPASDQTAADRALNKDKFSFPEDPKAKINETGTPLVYNTAYYRGMHGAKPSTHLEEQLHLASGFAQAMEPEHLKSFKDKEVQAAINPENMQAMGYFDKQYDKKGNVIGTTPLDKESIDYYTEIKNNKQTDEFYPRLMTGRNTLGLKGGEKYDAKQMGQFLQQGYDNLKAGKYTEPGLQDHLIEFYRSIGYPLPSSEFTKGATPEQIEQQKAKAAEAFRIANDKYAMQKKENANSNEYPVLVGRYGGFIRKR